MEFSLQFCANRHNGITQHWRLHSNIETTFIRWVSMSASMHFETTATVEQRLEAEVKKCYQCLVAERHSLEDLAKYSESGFSVQLSLVSMHRFAQ